MTDEELREIRARSDAASEDPSTWNTLGYSVVVNDVPRLLDEIERLRVHELSDDELLGGVLRRFLTSPDRPWYLVREDYLSLDGKIDISEAECKAILRAAGGWIDSIHVDGQADAEFYER